MLFPVPVEIVYEIKAKAADPKIVAIAAKIAALDTGLAMHELIQLVEFIEEVKKFEQFGETYLRKEATNLPRTIEIDPLHKRIFIHLKTHNSPAVGRGFHKHVTRSILYDTQQPTIVATAVTHDSEATRSEVALLEKFRNSEGIIAPIHVSQHVKKSGEPRFEIITPLYNRGSLKSFMLTSKNKVPLDVKISIARDILAGSSKLNALGYVNRDNNKGNFFIHQENGQFKAVVGDLGGYTATFEDAFKKKPLGTSLRSSPPDLHKAFYEERLTSQDLLSCHVFSLGRLFFFLLFEKDVPWLETFHTYPLIRKLYKDRSNPEVLQEIERLNQSITSFIQPRLEELSQKREPLELEEQFEEMILQMLSTDPEVRKTNAHWLQLIHELKTGANPPV